MIATLATEATRDGLDVLILTGDRDSLQLVTETCTVLYPMRGVSELARMTPAAVEDKYGVPPGRYPELAALVGETSDNLPGVPGVGPGLRRQVAQPVRRARQRHRARRRDHRQEGRGAARPPRRRDPQPAPQRAGPRPRPASDAQPTSRSARGTGRRSTPSSTASSSGCCATGSSSPWSPRRRSTAPASTSSGAAAGRRARWPPWLADHAGPRHAHRGRGAGQLARRHRRGLVGRSRGRRRRGRLGRRGRGDAEDDAALADWFADPDRPKVMHDAKGPMLALGRPRLAAAPGW